MMLQFHVVLDQPKGWLDYVMALGALGTVVAAVAALVAVNVTRSIARKQLDLQERQLRKDLYDRRFTVFADTGKFMKPILSTPSAFTSESDEYRTFRDETLQDADLLFGSEVREYLRDVSETTAGLSASNRRMTANCADINAIEENGEQFQHLSDLAQRRSDVFRREISLG